MSPLRAQGPPINALPTPGLHASYSRQHAHGLISGRRRGPDQLCRKRYRAAPPRLGRRSKAVATSPHCPATERLPPPSPPRAA
jgi:hypothetical protein